MGYGVPDPLQDSVQQALLNTISSLQAQLRNKEAEVFRLRKVVATRPSPSSNTALAKDTKSTSAKYNDNRNDNKTHSTSPNSQIKAQNILDNMARFDSFKKDFEDNLPYLRVLTSNTINDNGASPKPPFCVNPLQTPNRRRTNIIESPAPWGDTASKRTGRLDPNRRTTLADGEFQGQSSTPLWSSIAAPDTPSTNSHLPFMTPRRPMVSMTSRLADNLDIKDDELTNGEDDSELFSISKQLLWATSSGELLLNQARQIQIRLSEKEDHADQTRHQLEDVVKRQELEIKRLKRMNDQQEKLSNDIYNLHGEKEKLAQQLDDQKFTLTKSQTEIGTVTKAVGCSPDANRTIASKRGGSQ